MANLTPASSYDDVYQLETSDPVLGGAGAISNRQPQQLLNRTKFLKDALDALTGHLNDGTLEFDLADGSIAVTQIATDGTTKVATDAFVQAAIGKRPGRKNYLLNGAMRVAQRPQTGGTYPMGAGTPAYALDRWLIKLGAGTRSCVVTQEKANAISIFGATIKAAMKCALTAGSNTFAIAQRIENPTSLQGGSATIGLLLKSTVSQTLTVKINIYQDATTLLHTVSGTIVLTANEVARKTVTVTVPAIVSGDYGSLNYDTGFAEVEFNLPSASAFDFWGTQIQCETGTFASDFEQVSENQDVSDCKRYYEKTLIGLREEGNYTGFNKFWKSVFLTEKRINPACSVSTIVTSTSLSGGVDIQNVTAQQESVNQMSYSYTLNVPTSSYSRVASFELYTDSEFN